MRLETFGRVIFALDPSVERQPQRTRFGDLMRRGGARIAAMRNPLARRSSRGHLATLSEPILRDLGFTPDEIGLVRERRWCAYPHWQWR